MEIQELTRGAGILLAISSLPSAYGIGTIGVEAKRFVDLLVDLKQKYWQVLPVGPTSFGDSPYQPLSSCAGNTYLIDLDELVNDGLLTTDEIRSFNWGIDETDIDYAILYENRIKILQKAFQRFDIVRIDHFVGLVKNYTVPYEAGTAANGKWIKGPGKKLLDVLKQEMGNTSVIADDYTGASLLPGVKKLLGKTEYLQQLGDKEPNVKDCKYLDYYNFTKEYEAGYTQIKDTDWYYESRFWSEMPDLNLDNKAVRDEIAKISKFWLDKGVAGFRLDATTSYYTGNDENKRAPMVWHDDSEAEGMCKGLTTKTIDMKYGSVDSQLENGDSIYNYVCEGLKLRNAYPEIARGTTTVNESLSDDSILVLEKDYNGEKITIVMNTSAEKKEVKVGNDALKLSGLLLTSTENASYEAGIATMPAYSIMLLK